MLKFIFQVIRLVIAVMTLYFSTVAQAGPVLVTVNTSTLAGSPATLAFDLIGDQNNVAIIRQLEVATALGSQRSVGNVVGNFSAGVALRTKDSFLNEFFVDFTLSNEIVFELHLSNNRLTDAPPDAFSLFLLNASSGMPLFPTSDLTGADALFRIDIDGSTIGTTDIFDADGISVSVEPLVQEVPEPSTPLLIVPVLLFLVFRYKRAVTVCSMFCALSAGAVTSAHAQHDLSAYISIKKSGAVFNRTLGTYDYVVTVTNTSSNPILGPLVLGIKDVRGPEVVVHNASGLDDNANPQVPAALDFGILKPGASVKVPVQFLNPRSVPISYTVTGIGTILTPQESATLKVRTYTYSGNEDSPIGARAGAGIVLEINGVARAVTDSAGEATLDVPADVQSISAQRPPTTVGMAELELTAGRANSVDIIVHDDGEVYADGAPRIDEVQQMLLPSTFTSFTGRLNDARGKTIKLTQLASVDAYDSTGLPIGSLTSMFALSADGAFRPTDVTTLRTLLNEQLGRITLTIRGIDSADNVYVGDVSFHLSSNPVDGKLTAPVSFPGLRLDGIRVIGKILNTDIVVSTVTDANGRFAFPDLPNGNLSIAVESLQNNRYYYGSGVFPLTGPADLVIPLATAAENFGTNLPANLKAAADMAKAQSAVIGFNARRPEDLSNTSLVTLPELGANKAKQFAAGTSASVSVTADVQDMASTQTAKLTVRKGTGKVILTYVVRSVEYPYYVLKQSIYNDVWGIRLFGGAQGTQLFDITRQINSQLTQSPFWLPNVAAGVPGSTSIIERTFDVTNLAKDNDIELTLRAFATNIGDAFLPTSVNATIATSGGLSINSVTTLPDAWETKNDKSYYSIPATGNRNRFHRKVMLDFAKPDGATITNLKVELLGAGSDATILDTAPNADVALIGEDKVRSVITFKLESSSINSVPPPANIHQYRYTLMAKDADGNELTAEKIESGKHPLWRMPAGFARYSVREPGGDDWASRRTYLWMDEHRHLLRAINDISGEHGKNLKHATHARGSDIDMYHFYTFPGADPNNGGSNYDMLVARIRDLPKQDSENLAEKAIGAAAAAQVQAWVLASRSGIDALAAEPDVLEVGYIQAGPAPGAGISGAAWGETLLRTGQVTVKGKEFQIVNSTWSNSKYRAWPEHHHHVHITLSPDL